MEIKWYNEGHTLRDFQNALMQAGLLTDTEDITEFNTHPQRFDDEYEAWQNAGYPTEGDDNWDEFVELISGEEDEEDEGNEEDNE